MNVLCHGGADIKHINIVYKEQNPLFEVFRELRQVWKKGREVGNYKRKRDSKPNAPNV